MATARVTAARGVTAASHAHIAAQDHDLYFFAGRRLIQAYTRPRTYSPKNIPMSSRLCKSQRVHHTPAVISKFDKSSFTGDLPATPPKCEFLRLHKLTTPNFYLGWFATKIFHLNVSSAGDIRVNALKDWRLGNRRSSIILGHRSFRDRQISADLSESRICLG